MTISATEALFRTALGHHQAERLSEALDCYRQVLAADPHHLFARHYLGVALHQSGLPAQALPYLAETAGEKPDNAGFLVNLANANKDLGNIEAAEREYRTALSLNPDLPPAAFNLGQLLEIKGDLAGAAAAYRLTPALPPARERLATILVLDQPTEALALLPANLSSDKTAIAAAEYRLLRQAMLLMAHCERNDDVLRIARRLDQMAGVEALVEAGLDLIRQTELPSAKAVFLTAMEADPASGRAVAGYAIVENMQGYAGEAARALVAAMARGVDHPLAWEAYADSLKAMGDHRGAVIAMERVLRERPDNAAMFSSLQQLNLCRDDWSASDALNLAQSYGNSVRMYLRSRPATLPAMTSPPAIGGRRLRVGVLSPDLGMHPVGKFIVNFFRHHPGDEIGLWAFADRRLGQDPISEDIRRHAEKVVECEGWSDERLAETIAGANIDILLDLAGHTPGNRLPMLAWRPAPIQGTFLGYAGTTGSPAMDFRIADAYTEPPGAESTSSEQLLRLPGSYFCYDPGPGLPPPRPSPGDRPLTFGCFVQRIKITDTTLDLWLAVLRAVPEAVMQVRCRSFVDPLVVADFQRRVVERGGNPERFALLPWGAANDYYRLYEEIDIGLNTFPFQQATNLCDALWMGVPTLSLSGADHRSRMADSIMAAVGHPEWNFAAMDTLAAAAGPLAERWTRSPALREELRSNVPHSALADGPGFAQRLSAALRSLAA